jgi:hypothetical protein
MPIQDFRNLIRKVLVLGIDRARQSLCLERDLSARFVLSLFAIQEDAMEQKLDQSDQMMFSPDRLRQEALAVHARLKALQDFMRRQRAATAVHQYEASTEPDPYGEQVSISV